MDRGERLEFGSGDVAQESATQRESQVRRRIEEVEQETERFLAGDPEFLKALEKERAQFEQDVQEKVARAIVETDELVNGAKKRLDDGLKEAGVGRQEAEKIKKELALSQLFFQRLRRKFFKLMPWLLPAIFVAKIGLSRMNPEQPSHGKRVEATLRLNEDGIDDVQRSTYIPGVSELVCRAITPAGYQSLWDVVRQAPENLVSGREESVIAKKNDGKEVKIRKSQWGERNDAWRIYLGLPQEHKTFGISVHQPEKSQQDKYYFKINNWLESFSSHFRDHEKPPIKQIVEFIELRNQFKTDAEWKKHLEEHGLVKKFGSGLRDSTALGGDSVVATDIKLVNEMTDRGEQRREVHGVMGHFTLSKGRDERGNYISYYDTWNLEHAPIEGKDGFIGKSFEIYDRIYYSPVTYEAMD